MQNLKKSILTLLACVIVTCCVLVAINFEYNSTIAHADDNVAVAIASDGTQTEYATFSEAVSSLSDENSTIKLLNDGELCGFSRKTFTLDLNGKVLTNSENISIVASKLTIVDETGSGTIQNNSTIKIDWFSNVTMKGGTIIGAKNDISINCETYSGFTLENGTVDAYMWFSNNTGFNLTIANGRLYRVGCNATGSINVSGGEIGIMYIYRTDINVTLTGGSFDNLCFSGISPSYDTIIQEGYAYKQKNGSSYYKPSEVGESVAIEIVKCPHISMTKSVCDYCGYVCTHENIDSNTKTCVLCGYVCTHENFDSKTGTCVLCGYVCSHPSYDSKTGTCNTCGYSCHHDYYDADGYCTVCGYPCPHEDYNSSTGICNDCNKLTGICVNGTIFYKTFEEAIANIEDNSDTDLIMYSDCTLCAFENKKITVDLYGYALLNYDEITISNSEITILNTNFDNDNTVKTSASIVLNNTKLTGISGGLGTINASLTDGELRLKENSTLEIGLSATFDLTCPVYVDDETANVTLQSGNVSLLVANASATYAISDKAFIDELQVAVSNTVILKIGATVNNIVFLSDTQANYKSLLDEGNAYKNTNTFDYVKLSEMAECISVTVVRCAHESADENTYCEYCGTKLYVKVENSSSVRYYDNLLSAIDSLSDDENIVILNDLRLPEGNYNITKNVNLDLNGKTVRGMYVDVSATLTVTDSIGNGQISLFIKVNADVAIRISDSSRITIMAVGGNTKIYGGIIDVLSLYNGIKLSDLLPQGYSYRKVGENSERITWQDACSRTSVSSSEPIMVGKCEHEDVDDNLVCLYCNDTLDVGTVINIYKKNLEKAQKELSEAIATKADADTINQKIADLEKSIADTEDAIKKYSNDQDETLRTELNASIEAARLSAIQEANNALAAAKKELNDSISTKADAEEVNRKIEELNTAISNAQTTCNALATENDEALKSELNENIESARLSAIQEANNALATAKKELNDSISTKADAEEVNRKIEELNTAISNAQTTCNALATENDEALKSELNENIESARLSAIQEANNALAAAKKELNDSISTKADAVEVNRKIEELNTAISNAQTTCNALATEKDETLKSELNANIESARLSAIQEANETLAAAKKELKNTIDTKASAKEVESAISDLNTAIANAETVSKAYADNQNQELKTELENSLAQAKSEVTDAINALSVRVDELGNQVRKNGDTTKNLLISFIVFTVLLSLATATLGISFVASKRKR